MNLLARFRWLLLAVSLLVAGRQAEAAGFGLSATVSPNPVLTNNDFSFGIIVSNLTGMLLTNVFVTNTFSAGVSLFTETNSQGTNFIDSDNNLVFTLGAMTNGTSAFVGLTVAATVPGVITNTITVATTDLSVTNTAITNLVVQVAGSLADLAVEIIPPVQVVIANDLTTYDVIVTNNGPGSVPGVVLTNTLPPGIVLKSATRGYSLSGSNLIFNLGTLATGAGVDIQFLIQPTNVSIITLSATASAASLLDPDPTNNVAVTNIAITAYLAGTLVAVTNSSQNINPQNGLLEQSILLTNAGTIDAPAARLVVSGLTNQLFNAVGTNGTSPFVYLSAPLAAGASVNLVLLYHPRTQFPFTNGQLHAFPVPMPNWTPARVTATSPNLNIDKIVKLTTEINNGRMLIEFSNTVGQTYTVVYANDATFSNAMIAPPAIDTTANRVQWIDYGPPTTASPPASSPTRFYRVYQNP